MSFEEYLQNWFEDETQEIGLYLAMARQAEREGRPGIAKQLRQYANEEAEHAAIAAEIANMTEDTTKENLEKMVGGESDASKERKQWAEKIDNPEKSYLLVTAEDEERHKKALKGLLKELE